MDKWYAKIPSKHNFASIHIVSHYIFREDLIFSRTKRFLALAQEKQVSMMVRMSGMQVCYNYAAKASITPSLSKY